MANEFGFVYVLSNQSMPGIYKIGFTTRSPASRALELSKWTGVASNFVVEFYGEFEAPARVERAIHSLLDAWRVNDNREFFKANIEFIVEVIEQHCPISSWESADAAFARYQNHEDMHKALDEIEKLTAKPAATFGEVFA